MHPYRRLLEHVRPHVRVLGASFLCMFLTSLFDASPIAMIIPFVDRIMADKPIVIPDYGHAPVWITDLVNRVNTLPRMAMLEALIVLILVLTIGKSVFEYGYTYFMNDVSHRVIRDLRSEIYDKLVGLPLDFFTRNKSGALVSRITYDTGVVRDAICEGLKDLLFQPVELIAHIIVLLAIRQIFSIPWSLILTITLILPIIVYPIILLGKKLKKISRKSQEQMADIHSTLFESMNGIRVVQAFGMEEYEKKRFRALNWTYYTTMLKSIARTTLVNPITDSVVVICACLIVGMGGSYVVERGMSPGAFMAFLAALFSLFRPFKRLSKLHSINQTAMAAAERIFEILDAPSALREAPDPVFITPLKKAIEIRGVSFAYEAEKAVLKNVDLTIRAGEIVAVVGPSGAGKTTLVNLVPRFHDPAEGEVLIDGVPLTRVSLKSLRNQIGIVTQETILFNDTVAANIAYGRPHVAQGDIEAAAKTANAHEFIRCLPNGYQTVVGDRGIKLSGGEKQRIAIARAVFKNPPILILDEATSALDSESELLVQNAIANLMGGRTVLVIAHRLSTIKNASRIVVLENGRISGQGTHENLLTQNGLYRKIYEMQFSS